MLDVATLSPLDLLAHAFGDPDEATRKRALKLVDPKIRAILKPAFRAAPEHEACARLRALDLPDRGKLAAKLCALGTHGHGVAFDEDPEFAREFVHRLLVTSENTLDLTNCASLPHTNGKSVDITTIPDAVFDELPALRKTVPFDTLRIHGAPLADLPKRFAEFAPFLKRLRMWYVDFPKAVPDVVYACAKLEEFEICAREITDLGPIDRLANLRSLTLHECKKLKVLPAAIFGLPIEKLELGFAPMSTLPKEIGKLTKLRHLDMQSSKISKLPKELANCPLETINIRWSKLDKDEVRALLPKVTIEA